MIPWRSIWTLLLLPLGGLLLTGGACSPNRDSKDPSETGMSVPLPEAKGAPSPAENDPGAFPPNVAGGFYPGTDKELKAAVTGYLDAARDHKLNDIWGVISPHAGYVYSGPIAGSAFRQVKGRPIKRVVVIAFAHNPFGADGLMVAQGLGLLKAKSYATPLGNLPIDLDETDALLKELKAARESPDLFKREHSLEVQLPFIQTLFPEARLVPILFASQTDPGLARELARVIARRYAPDPETLVVASTDLSHYHDQATARSLDAHTMKVVTEGKPEDLIREATEGRVELCGVLPVLTMMMVKELLQGGRAYLLDLRSSADTVGDPRRVVGYAAAAFTWPRRSDPTPPQKTEAPTMDYELTHEQRVRLLRIARQTVESYVQTGQVPPFEVTDPLLLRPGAAFVTLKKDGDLRGCIGHTEARLPLWQCVSEMAVAACSQDPRFDPVAPEELPSIQYEITVLTPMQKVEKVEEIRVGRDGLMMVKGFYRGLLLPQVPVEWGWDRNQFLDQTAVKAGLPRNAWRDGSVTIYRFQGLVFSDQPE